MKGFWSYARNDDRQGKVSALKAEFGIKLGQATGKDDVDIYMDKTHIHWGSDWAKAIENALEASDFLIAILSPSYFKRQHCREEFTRALDLERTVYPIYYWKAPVPEGRKRGVDASELAIAKRVSKVQMRDFTKLRNKPLQIEEVQSFLDDLAEEIA